MKRKYQLTLIFLCILSAAAWFLYENSARAKECFPIKQVIIEGVYWQVPQEDLEAIIAPYVKQGYFLANLFSLQRTLHNIAWIETASVSRQWPGSIVVSLLQKNAVATLNNQILVTESGEIFSPPSNSFPPDLPVLLGPKEKAKEILNKYQVFTSAADSVNLSVTQVELSAEGNWSVKLNNKIVVMLGDEDILAKFKRFTKVYEQVFVPQHREPSYVDMRYSHGMAVNWKS